MGNKTPTFAKSYIKNQESVRIIICGDNFDKNTFLKNILSVNVIEDPIGMEFYIYETKNVKIQFWLMSSKTIFQNLEKSRYQIADIIIHYGNSDKIREIYNHKKMIVN